MNLIRLILTVWLAITCLSVPRALALNAQDIWFNPNESGWGINIAHQGGTIFATWFVYAANSQPLWFVSTMRQSASCPNNGYCGDLLQTTGTGFAIVPFVPLSAASVTTVGTARLTFPTARSGVLNYTVNGQSVEKQIVRQFLGTLPLAGTYVGGMQRDVSGCGNTGLNGSRLDQTRYTVALTPDGGTLSITESGGTLCRFTGSYQQYGSTFEGSGNFTCAAEGLTGTWTAREGVVTEATFSAKLSMGFSGDTSCVVNAVIGGFKPQ